MSDQPRKAAVQAQFAASAEAYVTSTVHANKPDLQRMVALAELRGDEQVLDIATGGGHTALAFAPHVREVVATDLTPAMLAAAERFITAELAAAGLPLNVRFERADAEALPFADGSFDVVTCRVAPHHFADVGLFVREVARVLRPGGVFVLDDTIAPADPALDEFINTVEQLRDPTHVRDYTLAEWQALCAAAGLRVTSSETFTKTLPFRDWCTRARVAPATEAELTRLLLEATPAARQTFAIVAEQGQVQQFELHSALVVARRA